VPPLQDCFARKGEAAEIAFGKPLVDDNIRSPVRSANIMFIVSYAPMSGDT
jgi:hypothetical protein